MFWFLNMPSRGQVSQSCCINIFSCMLQDPHSRQQQQQPPHPPSSARQQQQRGVRRQTTPGRPHPGSQPGEKPPPEPVPSAAKLNLAGIVWRKVWLAAAAVKDWEVHNTMHRGGSFVVAFVSSDLCSQPLRNCPGAAAGEEAGNYSALIYDNIIHRLNVCELVKSGFSVSIPPVLGL